jgi:protein tyrosine phosphatase
MSHAHPHSQVYSQGQVHAHSPQVLRPNKSNKTSSSPAVSPRATVYSVGQNLPAKLSPGRAVDAKASSPNYFGLVVEPANDSRDSYGLGRNQWSPQSSSVKSFGAAIQTQVPLDANPEFEAFKRQADMNRGKSFSLPTAHLTLSAAGNAQTRPRPPTRWHTHASDHGSPMSFGRSFMSTREGQPNKEDADQDSLHDSAYVSADSKRNSESSLLPLQSTGLPTRFESPNPIEGFQQRTNLTKSEDRDPRLSLMEHRVDPPSPQLGNLSRASTLPLKVDSTQPSMIPGDQLVEMMKTCPDDRLLILDIRSSQNYATSRIKGALNLCIPTTLLKRATFNIQKLQQTFQNSVDAEKFSKWQSMDNIVVYDAHSSDKRDAVTAQNMIKKFTNEGYNGRTHILRGGFVVFQEAHKSLVDRRSAAELGGKSTSNGSPGGLAPVIGGVCLPSMSNEPNPFFSNIRQNMDLADGVGQFELSRPSDLESPMLPQWLRLAASKSDKGKRVADKFLRIEKEEKARMQSAYAAFNPKNKQEKTNVQLCGVEKGGKNRYKDILPFEHARVKLNKPEGCCDYINASYIQPSGSNKRYIATQGPLPATYDDFWSAIWEQDVRVIVMLTAESEGGQLKCHPYWKEREYGPIKLKPLSEKKASLDIDKHRADSAVPPTSAQMGEAGRRRANTTTTMETSTPAAQALPTQSETPHVMIRKFALSHTSHPFAPIREITQLHFSSWPDFGAPAQPAHLLALVELANVMQRAALPMETASVTGSRRVSDKMPLSWHDEPEADAQPRPMMVHCSAGCGRTGTFCTVDTVIDMLKRQRFRRSSAASKQDYQGDIAMSGTDEPVSPRTPKRMEAPTFTPSTRRRTSQPSLPDDTTWMNDDNIDLIEKTVDDFRHQRLSMVQSLRQYVLCYESILEWVHRMNDRGAITSTNGRARSGSLRQQR